MSEVVPFPFLWYGAVCVTYVLAGTVGADSYTSSMLFRIWANVSVVDPGVSRFYQCTTLCVPEASLGSIRTEPTSEKGKRSALSFYQCTVI